MLDLHAYNCDKRPFFLIISTLYVIAYPLMLYLFLQHLILHKKGAYKVNQYFLNV